MNDPLLTCSVAREALHHVHDHIPVPHAAHHQTGQPVARAPTHHRGHRELVVVEEDALWRIPSQHCRPHHLLPEASPPVPRFGYVKCFG